jgi:dihydropteroate synthase
MVPVSEELNRLIPTIKQIKDHFPDVIISADTFRASVAIEAAKAGATIINDISGGTMDSKMFQAVIDLQLPYVLMHIKGTPQTMQDNPAYDSVVDEVFKFFLDKSSQLKTMGAKDIMLDLGFGFGKTLEHNYELLNGMQKYKNLELPILAGLSRKSMINKVLGTKASEALNGTTALNMIALQNGARLLRVHDVKHAVECIKLAGQIHLTS